MKIINLAICALAFTTACQSSSQDKGSADTAAEPETQTFQMVRNDQAKKVDVLIDGELFTSYIYPDNIMKPVLWPLVTSTGKEVTRKFPLDTISGERVDHPHHVGMWFNYGDVNQLDFWNNSEAIPEEKKNKYGTIRHQEILTAEGGDDQGVLEVTANWLDPQGKVLLKETSRYIFRKAGDIRTVERQINLTATDQDVSMKDNKEGMFAIRMTRALEHPSTGSVQLTDAQGNVTKVEAMENDITTGNYVSSEGIEGDAVWGTRADWVALNGKMEGEPVSVVIFDHPKNPGHPTYWHARGYGLFSANNLGQKELSGGKDELNYKLGAGESVDFAYKVLLHSGSEIGKERIDQLYQEFAAVQ